MLKLAFSGRFCPLNMQRGGYTIGPENDLSEDVHPNNAKIGAHVKIRTGTILFGSEKNPLVIGNDVVIGPRCYLQGGTCPIVIGDRVTLSIGTVIHTDSGPNHSTLLQKMFPITSGPVTIEDDVWIGSYAVILPGVTIGKGSVIGAHAVVKKSVPPGSIVDPVPVRIAQLPPLSE